MERLAIRDKTVVRDYASYFLIFLNMMSIFAIKAYFSLIAESLGATGSQVSMPSFLYSFVQVCIALPVGRLIDKTGPRYPVMCGVVLSVAGAIVLSISPSWQIVALSGLICGIANPLMVIGCQGLSISSGGEDPKTMGRVGGIMFASAVGQFVGPYAGGWIMDHLSRHHFWIIGMAMSLGVVLSFFLPTGAINKEKKNENVFKSIKVLLKTKNVFLAIGVSAIVLFSQETIITFFPLLADKKGIAVLAIGEILSMRGLSSMLVRPLSGALAKKFKANRLLVVIMFVSGVTITGYMIFKGFIALMVIAIVTGSFLGLAAPLSLNLVAEYAPAEYRGQAVSIRVICNYGGQGLSALIFGFLSPYIGYGPVFLITGCVMIVIGLIAKQKLD